MSPTLLAAFWAQTKEQRNISQSSDWQKENKTSEPADNIDLHANRRTRAHIFSYRTHPSVIGWIDLLGSMAGGVCRADGEEQGSAFA